MCHWPQTARVPECGGEEATGVWGARMLGCPVIAFCLTGGGSYLPSHFWMHKELGPTPAVVKRILPFPSPAGWTCYILSATPLLQISLLSPQAAASPHLEKCAHRAAVWRTQSCSRSCRSRGNQRNVSELRKREVPSTGESPDVLP